jgi:hypothetical protein
LCRGACGRVTVEHEVESHPPIEIDVCCIEHAPCELEIERTVILHTIAHTAQMRVAAKICTCPGPLPGAECNKEEERRRGRKRGDKG